MMATLWTKRLQRGWPNNVLISIECSWLVVDRISLKLSVYLCLGFRVFA